MSLLKEKKEQISTKNKELPLEVTAEKILKGAENECDNMGDDFLDTQHLLLSTLKVKLPVCWHCTVVSAQILKPFSKALRQKSTSSETVSL